MLDPSHGVDCLRNDLATSLRFLLRKCRDTLSPARAICAFVDGGTYLPQGSDRFFKACRLLFRPLCKVVGCDRDLLKARPDSGHRPDHRPDCCLQVTDGTVEGCANGFEFG